MFYLEGGITERERQRKIFHPLFRFPEFCKASVDSERNQEVGTSLSLPPSGKDINTRAVFHCFLRHSEQGVGLEVEQLDSKLTTPPLS